MKPPRRGDELWAIYYDRDCNNWIAKLEGRVSRVEGGRYLAGGSWHEGFPLFGSREDAEAYIAARPYQPPTIKP